MNTTPVGERQTCGANYKVFAKIRKIKVRKLLWYRENAQKTGFCAASHFGVSGAGG